MSDKQITEAKIMKALECCYNAKCSECPYEIRCIKIMVKDAIDLINRKNAENAEKDAEIKRLQDENLILQEKRINFLDRLDIGKRAGDQAIEEFVKEHKKIMISFLDDDNEFLMKWCEYEANTDNLANSMRHQEISNG